LQQLPTLAAFPHRIQIRENIMQQLIRTRFLQGCILLALTANPCHAAQEGIVLDPATGNYTITYESDGGLSETTFIPATKVEPIIQSGFRLGEKNIITYRYSVANGSAGKSAMWRISLDPIPDPIVGEILLPPNPTLAEAKASFKAMDRAIQTPSGWDNGIIRNGTKQNSIDWISKGDNKNVGILPGNKVSGFGFASQDLPGIIQAKFAGGGSGLVYADEGPAEGSAIEKQIEQLWQNDFVTRSAAVPTIAIPDPFDAAVTLERIQNHMHTWIDKQLLDPVFSSQLDRSFQSAISAYRLNQPRVGKQEIQSMRKLIEKEQPDLGRDEEHESEKSHEKHDDRKTALIDRLAARVLDFDLAYVTKRMADDEGEHKSARRHDR
jgi:hypothetical protein